MEWTTEDIVHRCIIALILLIGHVISPIVASDGRADAKRSECRTRPTTTMIRSAQ